MKHLRRTWAGLAVAALSTLASISMAACGGADESPATPLQVGISKVGDLTRCDLVQWAELPDFLSDTSQHVGVAAGHHLVVASRTCPKAVHLVDMAAPVLAPSSALLQPDACPWAESRAAGVSGKQVHVLLVCRLAGSTLNGQDRPAHPAAASTPDDRYSLVTISWPLAGGDPVARRHLTKGSVGSDTEPVFDETAGSFVIPCRLRIPAAGIDPDGAPSTALASDRTCAGRTPDLGIEYIDEGTNFADYDLLLLGRDGLITTWDEGLNITPDGGDSDALSNDVVDDLLEAADVERDDVTAENEELAGSFVTEIATYPNGAFVAALHPVDRLKHQQRGLLVRFEPDGAVDRAWGDDGVVRFGATITKGWGPIVAVVPDATPGSRRLLAAVVSDDTHETIQGLTQEVPGVPITWWAVDDAGRLEELPSGVTSGALRRPVYTADARHCGLEVTPAATSASLVCLSKAQPGAPAAAAVPEPVPADDPLRVRITSPADGYRVPLGQRSITVTAVLEGGNPGEEVTSMSAYVVGQVIEKWAAGSPFTRTIDLTGVREGKNELSVVADRMLNGSPVRNVGDSISFFYDRDGLAITDVTPDNEAATGVVTIRGRIATVDGQRIERLELATPDGRTLPIPPPEGSTGQFSVQLDTAPIEPGSKALYINATDSAGRDAQYQFHLGFHLDW